jgi:hypothetical protein
MKDKIRKYVKILRVELEDLEEDLLMMAEIYHEREQKDEISEFVFFENLALLQSEISGIDNIIKTLNEIDPSEFASIDAFVESIDTAFRTKTADAGFPDSVYALVKRKLMKVSLYLQRSEE